MLPTQVPPVGLSNRKSTYADLFIGLVQFGLQLLHFEAEFVLLFVGSAQFAQLVFGLLQDVGLSAQRGQKLLSILMKFKNESIIGRRTRTALYTIKRSINPINVSVFNKFKKMFN